MKTLLLTSMLGLAGFLTSCQTSTGVPESAVTCDKCRTVHFMAPFTGYGPANKGIVALRDSSRMTCPDCENQVIAMLKIGSLTKHVCSSCGGTLSHCRKH